MGSDVYGLPSRETYPDSQNFRSDGAKIKTIIESSKYLSRKNAQSTSQASFRCLAFSAPSLVAIL